MDFFERTAKFYHAKGVANRTTNGYNPLIMENDKVYQQTLDYLYSFVDYSLTKADRLAQANFNLSRMVELMHLLGDPHKAYPLIHVAGTKGKGSVTAMCSSILQAAGYRTGMYTSPHLEDYAERIQVNGKPIPHSVLVELVERIKPHIETIANLTTFEITTALAFLYFKEVGVDAAVIEVGLGGRLDATNIVSPAVSVITSISYDHTQVLGKTLTAIATEKCGIIKPAVPVVSAPQEAEPMAVIEQIAEARNAPLKVVGRHLFAHSISRSLNQQVVEFSFPSEASLANHQKTQEKFQFVLPLLGDHQVENAAVAYLAIDCFRQKALRIDDAQIREGYLRAFWPGRFEILKQNPAMILDCAHNRESCHQLVLTLDTYFPQKKVLLIFGASEDKDIDGMFDELLPRVDQTIFVKSFHPRAISPYLLLEKAKQLGTAALVIENISEALTHALSHVSEEQVILVTGSIFVVAEARHAWQTHLRSTVINPE
jgi:dihydrofolate synthase/folylpolyglutamate synthase